MNSPAPSTNPSDSPPETIVLTNEIRDAATLVRSSSHELSSVLWAIMKLADSAKEGDPLGATTEHVYNALRSAQYLSWLLSSNCNEIASLLGVEEAAQ